MDVAKRLDFDPTETLTGNAVAEAATAGQRCPQSANAAALADLQKCGPPPRCAAAQRLQQKPQQRPDALLPRLPLRLPRAVQELAAAAKQKQAHMLALAKQSAEQGVGDNDLKRLKRQFDSNKATFVNIDQKQRFMQGGSKQAARMLLIDMQGVIDTPGLAANQLPPCLLLLHRLLLLRWPQGCWTCRWTLSS